MEPQEWIDRGYRRWETNKRNFHKLADFGLQKRFDDEVGKKYFITVYVYDWEYNNLHRGRVGSRWDYSPTIRFGDYEENIVTFDVTYHFDVERDTIEKMEQFFEDLWIFAKKPYYEKWD